MHIITSLVVVVVTATRTPDLITFLSFFMFNLCFCLSLLLLPSLCVRACGVCVQSLHA